LKNQNVKPDYLEVACRKTYVKQLIYISKSTQDLRSWIKTGVVFILPAIVFIIGTICLQYTPLRIGFFIMGLVLLFILIFGIICTPYRIGLTETHLILHRYIGNMLILLKQINTILAYFLLSPPDNSIL
jgi:hypothetical protein